MRNLLLSLLGVFLCHNAIAVQLDCSSLDPNRNTVLLLNLNRQKRIEGSVQQAAQERGENLLIIPNQDNPEDVNMDVLYSTLSELKKCGATLSSVILAAHDGGGSYWGGTSQQGFSHDSMMTAFRHFGSVTKNISSTYFWGCNSNARGTLRGIYRPSQETSGSKESARCQADDTACLKNMKNFDKFYRGAFPIKTIWGDDQSALSNSNPIATNYLYLLMKEEDRLTKISNIQNYRKQLNEIRCRATTFLNNANCSDPLLADIASVRSLVSIAGTNGNCYYHRVGDSRSPQGARIEISALDKAPSIASCQQELTTFDANLLGPLLEARLGCDGEDCSPNNPADMRDIPDDTTHGKVREVYEYFTGDSDCQLVSDPSVAKQFPNITLLRDLLFYNKIRDAIVANHGSEIDQLNTDIAQIKHASPKIELLTKSDIVGKNRTLSRADLLQKLRRIQSQLEENMTTRSESPSPQMQEAHSLLHSFYQLLTLEPDSSFHDSHCQRKGLIQESCLLNAMIPPGWAEGAVARSPIFSQTHAN